MNYLAVAISGFSVLYHRSLYQFHFLRKYVSHGFNIIIIIVVIVICRSSVTDLQRTKRRPQWSTTRQSGQSRWAWWAWRELKKSLKWGPPHSNPLIRRIHAKYIFIQSGILVSRPPSCNIPCVLHTAYVLLRSTIGWANRALSTTYVKVICCYQHSSPMRPLRSIVHSMLSKAPLPERPADML